MGVSSAVGTARTRPYADKLSLREREKSRGIVDYNVLKSATGDQTNARLGWAYHCSDTFSRLLAVQV